MRQKFAYLIKKIILGVFYKGHFHPRMYNMDLGQVLAIFFFQKFLGYNGHIPYPVHFTNRIMRSGKMDLPLDVQFSFATSTGLYVQKMNDIYIGAGTIIAPGVKLISANHDPSNIKAHAKEEPIRIGLNCWLGANAVILPGVSLGNNVIVGAGAVVSKSFPDGSVVGGVPARVLKTKASLAEQS